MQYLVLWFTLFLFTLLTVRKLNINQLIRQVYLGSLLEVISIIWETWAGAGCDVIAAGVLRYVANVLVGPTRLWNKDVNKNL